MDASNEYIKAHYLEQSDSVIGETLGLSSNAVEKRRKRMGLKKDSPTPAPTEADALDGVASLLRERGVSADQIGNVSTVTIGNWKTKENPDGPMRVVLKMSPTWEDGPEWPVIQPAPPLVVKSFNVVKNTSKSTKTAVILPDPQIGYRLDTDYNLDPFHDEAAFKVALSIIKDVNPDLIVNLGDYLDFAEFGRFAQEAAFARTTQKAINRASLFLGEQRAASRDDTEIVLFEGNHDRRLQNSIEANAVGAFGLQQANKPDSWPVLSVPHLLRLDDLGVTYVDGYPAGEYWINDRLRCEHGSKTGPRGKVAAKMVADERVSVICGHTHRVEKTLKTTPVQGGARVNAAYTMGCLCRIDGAVPSTRSATDARGKPMVNYEDWQQAVGIVEYVEGDGPFDVHEVLIHEGKALFGGTLYAAE